LKTAVLLCEFEDRSLAEAAEVAGCSAKAVETRLDRARALLRESLAALFLEIPRVSPRIDVLLLRNRNHQPILPMISLSRSLLFIGFFFGVARLAAVDAMDMKNDMKPEILSAYVKVSAALAADDLAAAKTAAAAVAAYAGMSDNKDIATRAGAVAKAATIEAARGAFKELSVAVEPLAAGQKDYVVMYCPMAESDWVQPKGATRNPYFGKAMLTCGEPKKMK